MLLAHRLGRKGAQTYGAIGIAAGRRGLGGRRGSLGEPRRAVEPTIEGGSRGQPSKTDRSHQGSRYGQVRRTNGHHEAPKRGKELSQPKYGPFRKNVPASL